MRAARLPIVFAAIIDLVLCPDVGRWPRTSMTHLDLVYAPVLDARIISMTVEQA